MRLFLIILIYIPGHCLALTAAFYKFENEDIKINLNYTSKFNEQRSCLKLKLSVSDLGGFPQYENEDKTGGVNYINKEYSGVSLVNFSEATKNPYEILHRGSEIHVNTYQKDEVHETTLLCIPDAHIKTSYILVRYVLPQTCPELIYIPVSSLKPSSS